jgi:hypothetical protein
MSTTVSFPTTRHGNAVEGKLSSSKTKLSVEEEISRQ